MKILHIFDHSIPLHSGYTFRSRAILQHQQQLGLTTCHITSAKQGVGNGHLKEKIEDLEFYRTPPSASFIAKLPVIGQLVTIFSLAKRLKQVAQIEQPDILHAHSPALNGMAALMVGRKLKIPVTYEIRAFWEDAAVDHGHCQEGDFRYRLSKMIETYVVKNCQAVTTICQGLKQDLVSRGVNEQKITIIANAVNVAAFPQITHPCATLYQKFQLDDAFVVGFAGSFYHYEGIDVLLEAFAILKARSLKVKLLLVGGGSQQHNIEQLIKKLTLESMVIMTGRVPHEAVKDYYSVMDVTALPRKSMRLTELVTPLKPLEAMALGIPVLASDIGGHQELITNNETGFLFKADDPSALADAIEAMINSPKPHKIIEKARCYVENTRNWQVSVANYSSVYQYAKSSRH